MWLPSNIALDTGPNPCTRRGDLGLNLLSKFALQIISDNGMVMMNSLNNSVALSFRRYCPISPSPYDVCWPRVSSRLVGCLLNYACRVFLYGCWHLCHSLSGLGLCRENLFMPRQELENTQCTDFNSQSMCRLKCKTCNIISEALFAICNTVALLLQLLPTY